MTTNLLIQYTAVGVLLLAALGWIVWKSINLKKGKAGCSNCSMAHSCAKPADRKLNRRSKDDTNKNCGDCCKSNPH